MKHLHDFTEASTAHTYELRIKAPNINKFVRKIAENYRTVHIEAVALINDDGTKVLL